MPTIVEDSNLPAKMEDELCNNALKDAGCEKIITDTVSGARVERPGLTKLKALLRKGDTLVI